MSINSPEHPDDHHQQRDYNQPKDRPDEGFPNKGLRAYREHAAPNNCDAEPEDRPAEVVLGVLADEHAEYDREDHDYFERLLNLFLHARVWGDDRDLRGREALDAVYHADEHVVPGFSEVDRDFLEEDRAICEFLVVALKDVEVLVICFDGPLDDSAIENGVDRRL